MITVSLFPKKMGVKKGLVFMFTATIENLGWLAIETAMLMLSNVLFQNTKQTDESQLKLSAESEEVLHVQ